MDEEIAASLDPAMAGRLLRALDEPDCDPPGHAPALPGYRFDRVLGRGAAGVVWRAFRDGHDRPLAIKYFHRPLADSPMAARFWREIDILSLLGLACVPRIESHGLHQGRPFIACDFIEGTPLRFDHAPETSGDLRARVETLARVGECVQLLHERGVIHRDLKPANILIRRTGDPAILDLGLAILDDDRAGAAITDDGVPLGTPAYMSPEQARGERSRISTRSDVYSIGACAYEALTGHTPHDAGVSLHELIRSSSFDPPRDPRALSGSIPEPLACVLTRACDLEPDRRYASAGEFAAELRRFLRGEPVLAQPPTPLQRAARWAAAHPRTLSLAAGAAIIASSLALSAGANWYYFRQPSSVSINDPLREVRLHARSGSVLRVWRYDQPRAGTATIVRTPGRDPVLVLTGEGADFGEADRAIGVYRLTDLDHAIWASGDRPPRIEAPREFRRPEDRFVCQHVEPVDVLTDPPGMEILARHQHFRYAYQLLRLYDRATGRVLFEAWHHGTVSGVACVQTPGGPLLIAAGLSNAHVPHRPPGPVESDGYTSVVFALPVVPGQRLGWVNLTPKAPDRPAAEPAWYKFLNVPAGVTHPLLGDYAFVILQARGVPVTPEGTIAEVEIAVARVDPDPGSPGFHIILGVNARGEVTYRHATDGFEATFAGLLRLADIDLADRPPRPVYAPDAYPGTPRP